MIRLLFFIVLFMSISTGVLASEFEVTGIVFEEPPMAVINGTIVKVGEEIDGAIVKKIVDETVHLKYKGEIIIKNVSGKRLPEDNNQIQKTKRLPVSKSSKGIPVWLFFVLALILAGAAFYFSGKNKEKKESPQSEEFKED